MGNTPRNGFTIVYYLSEVQRLQDLGVLRHIHVLCGAACLDMLV